MATTSSITENVANVWLPLLDEKSSFSEPGAAERSRFWKDEATAHCSRPACEGTAQYQLNGAWACSEACLHALMQATVARHALEAKVQQVAPTRVQLGRILIEQGSITEAQLEQALRSQRATGAGRLGCWLRQQVDLPEADFAAALSVQWRCPVFRVGNFSAARMAGFLPRILVEQNGALPLRVTGDPARLSVCFEDHIDDGLLLAMQRMHGLIVEAGLLTASDFWQVTRELMSVSSVPSVAAVAPSIDRMTEAMSLVLARAQAKSARLVVVNDLFWLRFWRRAATPLADLDRPATAGTAQQGGPVAAGTLREDQGVRDVVCGISTEMADSEAEVSRLANRMMEGWR